MNENLENVRKYESLPLPPQQILDDASMNISSGGSIKLYDDNYNIIYRYTHLMNTFNSVECSQLINTKLIPFVRDMLTTDIELLYYLQKYPKDTMFNIVYDNIIVEKKSFFEKISCKYNNFALTWLFTRYH
jgi:hypothetical protein